MLTGEWRALCTRAVGYIGKLDLQGQNLGEVTRSLDTFEGRMQRCKNMKKWR